MSSSSSNSSTRTYFRPPGSKLAMISGSFTWLIPLQTPDQGLRPLSDLHAELRMVGPRLAGRHLGQVQRADKLHALALLLGAALVVVVRSEEHTSELQSR